MSVLYSGRDLNEDRVVAIKSMRPYDFVSEVKRTRFLHEIRVTSQLKHPNIVDLLDSGEDSEGAPYLVMELLEGRNLQEELDSRDPVPPQEALQWVLPLIGALAYAHDHGIIHRDIKPGNIFLSRDPNGSIIPKILDFGISVVSDATRVTRSGVVVGTAQYMSPEQASDREVGPKTDIWSMGVVLYHCLTGKTPFEASSVTSLLFKIVNDPVPDLRELASDLGPCFPTAVMRALKKKTQVRYSDMREFARALCLTALSDDITLPDNPDPTGLPEWDYWIENRFSYGEITSDLEEVPAPAQIEKIETGSVPAQPSIRRSRNSLRTLKLATGLFFAAIAVVWAWYTFNSRVSPKRIVNQTDTGRSRRMIPNSTTFPASFISAPIASPLSRQSIADDKIDRGVVEKEPTGATRINKYKNQLKRKVRPPRVSATSTRRESEKSTSPAVRTGVTENQKGVVPTSSTNTNESVPPPITTW